MTPEERAAHEAWQRTHAPGDPAKRATERERRRQDRDAAAMIGTRRVVEKSPEEIAASLLLSRLRTQLAIARSIERGGVFG